VYTYIGSARSRVLVSSCWIDCVILDSHQQVKETVRKRTTYDGPTRDLSQDIVVHSSEPSRFSLWLTSTSSVEQSCWMSAAGKGKFNARAHCSSCMPQLFRWPCWQHGSRKQGPQRQRWTGKIALSRLELENCLQTALYFLEGRTEVHDVYIDLLVCSFPHVPGFRPGMSSAIIHIHMIILAEQIRESGLASEQWAFVVPGEANEFLVQGFATSV
jgi:hypothetical protein